MTRPILVLSYIQGDFPHPHKVALPFICGTVVYCVGFAKYLNKIGLIIFQWCVYGKQ
jgi:hypothetical protein